MRLPLKWLKSCSNVRFGKHVADQVRCFFFYRDSLSTHLGDPRTADETLVDMAVVAAQRALASAGRDASEVETVIGASSSDNDAFPTVAGQVATRLGLGPIRATMLKGACACQTEAFQICSEVLQAGSAKLVLLVTAEGLLPNSRNVLDWKTSSLFGEGVSAFLLERGDQDTYLMNGSKHGAKAAEMIRGVLPSYHPLGSY